MAKREFSAGGIVFRKKDRQIEVLLIKDSYGRWTWPKGNIEQGEKSHQAALREIREETGLNEVRILAKMGENNYFYRLRNDLVFKTVVLFIAETNLKERLKIQESEIKDARWFKCKKALKIIEYKGAEEKLAKAVALYKLEKRKNRCSE